MAAAQGIQDLWHKETPPTIRPATGKLRSVTLTALLQNFGLKGARRRTQFAYGPPSLETYPRLAFILGAWTSYRHLRRVSSGKIIGALFNTCVTLRLHPLRRTMWRIAETGRIGAVGRTPTDRHIRQRPHLRTWVDQHYFALWG